MIDCGHVISSRGNPDGRNADALERARLLAPRAGDSTDDADRFLAAADEVIAARGAAVPRKLGGGSYTIIHAVEHTAGLDELMDHPGTFPIILDLMGPYLQLMGTQIYVRPPGEHSGFNWHTDAGPSLQRIRVTDDSPPLNFKVQFFLTDIPEEDSANFCL